jgi:hypothetical protein
LAKQFEIERTKIIIDWCRQKKKEKENKQMNDDRSFAVGVILT